MNGKARPHTGPSKLPMPPATKFTARSGVTSLLHPRSRMSRGICPSTRRECRGSALSMTRRLSLSRGTFMEAGLRASWKGSRRVGRERGDGNTIRTFCIPGCLYWETFRREQDNNRSTFAFWHSSKVALASVFAHFPLYINHARQAFLSPLQNRTSFSRSFP